MTSFVYTDRPVYRPEQKVYFKGILRERTDDSGYRLPPGTIAAVTVDDQNGAPIFEQELPLSTRGTFSGELDLPEESPLGSYTISAAVGESARSPATSRSRSTRSPSTRCASRPRRPSSARARRRASRSRPTTSSARPSPSASVKYYVYRSRYYGWWSEGDADAEDEIGADPTAEDGGDDYGGYADEMVHEGDGKLDAQGQLDVEFNVPAADAKETWDYSYRLEAQVTDAARRSMERPRPRSSASAATSSPTPSRQLRLLRQGDTAHVQRPRPRPRRAAASRRASTSPSSSAAGRRSSRRPRTATSTPDYETKEKELSSSSVRDERAGRGRFTTTWRLRPAAFSSGRPSRRRAAVPS